MIPQGRVSSGLVLHCICPPARHVVMRAGQDLDDLYGDDQSVDDLSVGDLSVLYTREKGGKTKTEPLTRSNRPVSFHRANVVSTGRSPDRVCVRVFFFYPSTFSTPIHERSQI